MKARKKELGDWHENRRKDREPKCSHYPVKSVASLMSTRHQRLGKQRIAVSFGEVFETLLISWNSLPSLGRLSPKYVPRLLTVMHTCRLSVQRSLRWTWGMHCEYVPLVIKIAAFIKVACLSQRVLWALCVHHEFRVHISLQPRLCHWNSTEVQKCAMFTIPAFPLGVLKGVWVRD